jgi:hypothetical protein
MDYDLFWVDFGMLTIYAIFFMKSRFPSMKQFLDLSTLVTWVLCCRTSLLNTASGRRACVRWGRGGRGEARARGRARVCDCMLKGNESRDQFLLVR